MHCDVERRMSRESKNLVECTISSTLRMVLPACFVSSIKSAAWFRDKRIKRESQTLLDFKRDTKKKKIEAAFIRPYTIQRL